MYLYIIRHGEPHYPTDSLTENGKIQADALANRFALHGFDAIYSSPMGRAKQTAEPTCSRLQMDYVIEDWMSEGALWEQFAVPDAEGKREWVFAVPNAQLLEQSESLDNWQTHPVYTQCGTALEGYQRIKDASDEFLSRLGYTRDGKVYRVTAPTKKRVAAFCHHGFGITWLSHLLSIPLHLFWASFNIVHTGVTVLDFGGGKSGVTAPQCVCLSDISHIYKENAPLSASFYRNF
jgi:probable phosphoglycerate mutase